jgi:hypothetical protein
MTTLRFVGQMGRLRRRTLAYPLLHRLSATITMKNAARPERGVGRVRFGFGELSISASAGPNLNGTS